MNRWLAITFLCLLWARPAVAQPMGDDSGDSSVGDSSVGDSSVGDSSVGDSSVGDSSAGGGDSDLPPIMRNPRKLSGVARGEQTDPPGSLTIRAVQGKLHRSQFGDIRGAFPAGTPVYLVGIDSKGKVTLESQKLDPQGGRVHFTNLKLDGSVAYYALSLFARKGAVDRLQSRPVVLPPRVGMRMMLAGLAPDSGKPPADDLLGNTQKGGATVPGAGTVLVAIEGETDDVGKVELLDAAAPDKPVATARPEVTTEAMQPRGSFSPPAADGALRDGLLQVVVKREGKGVSGIPVALTSVGQKDDRPVATSVTDGEGKAMFEGLAGKKVLAHLDVHGRRMTSPELDVPKKGGLHLGADVNWRELESLLARFSGVDPANGKVYLARLTVSGSGAMAGSHLSPPFQLTPDRGASTSILLFPSVLLSFHGGGQLDDDRFGFQIQFSLFNPSVMPYDPGPDGLLIALPKGFTAAGVEDQFAARVKVDNDRGGLVWRGAVPPGQRDFIAGFALPTPDGHVAFDMPLPLGAFDSQMVLEKLPGVTIDAPPQLNQRPEHTDDGRPVVVLDGIQMRPGDKLSLSLDGLPQHPAWNRWVRIGTGALVGLLFLWGAWGLAIRFRSGGGKIERLEAEREDLLQAMVQLEADVRKKKMTDAVYHRHHATLRRKLEGIYAELAAARGEPVPAGAGEGTRSGGAARESDEGSGGS